MSEEKLSLLPLKIDFDSRVIWKRLVEANKMLANLNGFSKTIPNQYVLINALSLQEAKDSSEIESIITTHDELYKAGLYDEDVISPQAKEVRDYAKALNKGFQLILEGELLTVNNICEIQRIVERNDAGIRTQRGTVLQNSTTRKIVYEPPQEHSEILALMANLERVINDDDFWPDVDPLIKMAVIHYQFERIHPFYDGNGRTGRIINVLYLVLKQLLDTPILYLSRYIISHKTDYYRLFNEVSLHEDWESFVLFMLDAVIETSKMTIQTIKAISDVMKATKAQIRGLKFYSRDLLDALFLFPYTRIDHLAKLLNIHRNTAATRLKKLTETGVLKKVEIGRNHYYVNTALFDVLTALPECGEKNDNLVGH